MDLGYPVRREEFLVAVEREETELSDALTTLAPALSGDGTFPCSSSFAFACSTASAMMVEMAVLESLDFLFSSACLLTTQACRSFGKEMFNFLCVFSFIYSH